MSTSDAAGLPDIAALTALANQLFSALPSSASALSSPALPSAASAPPSATARPSAGPAAAQGPAPLGSGLPLGGPPPAGFGLPSAAQLEERLAPRPGLRAGADTSFGAGGFPAPHAHPAVPASQGSDLSGRGAAPAGFGLPTEAQLRELLTPAHFGIASAPPKRDCAAFYFLDHQRGPSTGHLPAQPGEGSRSGAAPRQAPFDVELVRRDFPILQERVHGRQLVWLDNAATTQKPRSVIDRLSYFYAHENSNIHRAAHELAARASDAYESAREKVRGFLNAASPNEIVFVRGATEAINLVAQSWGREHIGKDDEIIISWLEHHANIVPWQQLCAEKGAKLKVIPVDDSGQILLDEYAKLLGPRTRLVAFTHVSNALGTVTPAKQIIDMAHAAGARVLVDGAQAVSHLRADVQYLACDWYVFSGHKVFGPTGIGVLYGKEALLNDSAPWQGGGNMIKDVTFERTEYHAAPSRFEAGTGNIADAVGLGAAIDYVNRIGIDAITAYEHQLLVYATGLLKDIPGVRLIGTAADKASVLSFVLEGFTTQEVGAALSREGIAVRSGHHCAQPILRRFGVEGTVRPSLAFYNNNADVEALVAVVGRLKRAR
ncbi:MAG: family 2A encapsulin nanocompartment cargo protein cysteine desulfurase [Pseudomonadota bacterium]